MTVLITGAGGQLANALLATDPRRCDVEALDINTLDITDANAVRRCIQERRPRVIINTAAWTAVDDAETHPREAEAANTDGPRFLAESAGEVGARLVQISTDFVFDGTQTTPYKPSDPTNPLSVYGQTKLGGEAAVLGTLGERALVVRTAWLYEVNGQNFVNTMLRLMRERGAVNVVNDQTGSPTWARSLAGAIWSMLERELAGIHHWTDAGSASWFDFAVAIGELGFELGALETAPLVTPVGTESFPTPATRPVCSVLDKSATWGALEGTPCMPAIDWRAQLANMLKEYKRG